MIEAVRRRIKGKARKAEEDRIMRQVRREDRYCRFPMCGCGRMKLSTDVAHIDHRGMGGNPKLDRTVPEKLILLCRPRHRAHKFAVDRKTLRIEALTDRGMRGPVRWGIEVALLPEELKPVEDPWWPVEWLTLATETAPHRFEPFTPAQAAILKYLAEMTV